MKRIATIILTILLAAAMMAVPALAAESPAANITAVSGMPGETVTLTVSLSGMEKAASIAVKIEADEDLELLEDSAWLLSSTFDGVEAGKAYWAVDNAVNVNGDVLKLVYQLPEAFDQSTFNVKVTIDVNNSSTVIAQGLEANAVITCAHSYEAEVVAPTCTKLGHTVHTCAYCGDTYYDTYVNALGHEMGEWETTKEPTTTEEGEETRYCQNEGCEYSETNTLPVVPDSGERTITGFEINNEDELPDLVYNQYTLNSGNSRYLAHNLESAVEFLITYSDGTTETAHVGQTVNGETVTVSKSLEGPDGENTFTFSLADFSIVYSAEFMESPVESLEIVTEPTFTLGEDSEVYKRGEQYRVKENYGTNYKGLQFKINYTDGTSKIVDFADLEWPDYELENVMYRFPKYNGYNVEVQWYLPQYLGDNVFVYWHGDHSSDTGTFPMILHYMGKIVTFNLYVEEGDTLAILYQPTEQNADYSQTATFYVGATGQGLGYQWQYRTSTGGDWQNCSEDSANTSGLEVVAVANNGYQYRCVVTDSAGTTLYSEAAALTVNYPHKLENGTTYALTDLVLGDDGIYRTPDGYTMYIAVNNTEDGGLEWLGGNMESTLYQYVNDYGDTYFDLTYWDVLVALMDENGYTVLNEETLEYLVTLTTGNSSWGETRADAQRYLAYDYMKSDTAECTHSYHTHDAETACEDGPFCVYTAPTAMKAGSMVRHCVYGCGVFSKEVLPALSADETVKVKIADVTITVGETPVFGFTVVEGEVPEDGQIVLEYACGYDGTTAGTYEITATVTSAPAGYNVQVEKGTLTVEEGVPTGKITDTGRTLSLSEVVYINQYVKIEGFDGIDVTEKGGLLVWEATDADFVLNEAEATYENCSIIKEGLYAAGSEFTQRTDGIAARRYADKFYIRVYVEVADGQYVYGPLKEFSAQIYCEAVLNKASAKEELKNTCAALLHYGTAAQIYFDDYNPFGYANANILEDYPAAEWDENLLTPVDMIPEIGFGATNDVKDNGKTLSLSGAVEINYYFVPEFSEEIETAELLLWRNVEGKLTTDNVTAKKDLKLQEGEYSAQSMGIASNGYDTTVYACAHFVDENGKDHYSDVVAFSPEEYAARVLQKSTTKETLKEVCRRMVIYGECAKLVFG